MIHYPRRKTIMSHRPLSIHFVTPKNAQSATSRYRVWHFAEALSPEFTVSVNEITENRFVFDAPDIVVLHRLRYHGEADRVLAAARQVGAVTVASVDDLIFSPEYAFQAGLTSPPDDPAFYRYHRAEADDHLRTLTECDAVITSTDFLANEARIAVGNAKPVFCLRNFLNVEMVKLANAAHELQHRRLRASPATRTFAYLSGSPTHDLDFAEIAPVLAGVMANESNTRLLLVGTVALPPVLQTLADAGRVRRHPFVPWRDLFALTAQADVTLAPLDVSRLFNHAKSEIKALEAGAVGVPTIASHTAGVAEANIATLCRTPDEWANTLLLPKGETMREAVNQTGTVAAHRERVRSVYAEIAALKTGAGSATATVSRPLRERLEEHLRGMEENWVWRKLRWERHNRLLKDDVRKRR